MMPPWPTIRTLLRGGWRSVLAGTPVGENLVVDGPRLLVAAIEVGDVKLAELIVAGPAKISAVWAARLPDRAVHHSGG